MKIEEMKTEDLEEIAGKSEYATGHHVYEMEDEIESLASVHGKWNICRLIVTGEGQRDEAFFFELRTPEGEKLLTSEEYNSYNGALRGIETYKANINRDNFKVSVTQSGEYLFKLLSGKGMLLCLGEHYTKRELCDQAVALTKRFARVAVIDENVQDIFVTPPPESEAEYEDLSDEPGKWIISAHQSADEEKVFSFDLRSPSGEILLTSEEYTTFVGAVNGIGTHRTNIARGNFKIALTRQGDYIFKLMNANGQLLCLGEHFKTRHACERMQEAVKRYAMKSKIYTDSSTMNH